MINKFKSNKILFTFAIVGVVLAVIILALIGIKSAWITYQAQNMKIIYGNGENELYLWRLDSEKAETIPVTQQLVSELEGIFKDMKNVRKNSETPKTSEDRIEFMFMKPRFYTNGFAYGLKFSFTKGTTQFYTCDNYDEIFQRILKVCESYLEQ